MAVSNVPVNLGKGPLGGQVHVGSLGAAGIDAIACRDRRNLVDLRLAEVADRVCSARAFGTINRTRCLVLAFFVREEEEQRVLDDRPTDSEAAGVLAGITVPFVAGGILANHLVGILIRVIRAAVKFVGAALGNRIHRCANATASGHVVVSYRDVVFLDRVRRDRRALGRQAVVVQTKRVARVDRVDGDRVVAEVLARRREGAAIAIGDNDTRISAHDVLDRAIRLWHGDQVALRQIGADALVVGRERIQQRRCSDNDAFQRRRGRRCPFGDVDRGRLGEAQIDVIDGGSIVTGRYHAVWTTNAQALRLVATVRIGRRDGLAA